MPASLKHAAEYQPLSCVVAVQTPKPQTYQLRYSHTAAPGTRGKCKVLVMLTKEENELYWRRANLCGLERSSLLLMSSEIVDEDVLGKIQEMTDLILSLHGQLLQTLC